MEKTTYISGKCIPLEMNDVDTDLIIPAQYLTSVVRKGYGENLFKRLRESSKDFVFNLQKYSGANVLVTQNNFGCGSSREHAVWALKEYGIQVIIANSFADIFAGNSLKNRLVLIKLTEDEVKKIIQKSKINDYILEINLAESKIQSSCGDSFSFNMDDFQKSCFINGFDEIEYLRSFKDKVIKIKQEQSNKNIIPKLNRSI
ncbi:3-isopropylmalate dehydratase small subunit [Fluviispira multicolorata]|uniref:3-isopropylmalate dehydratase small subunit n=1 Tax=Fluviispira multicolorata TaxID=2654512 RepID=A0A833JF98_9BACT|nr:3-isopropylmalate dehydratase small subunit [Fluviispira multicolorata]KAB8033170.1 3-isopropylmalate dehydratase small subunit [Fluviispira multicolorata]